MDLTKYRTLFVTESREHLDGIGKDLLTLEKDPANRPSLDNLFRHAHSIKGMAASMGYDAMAQLSHKLEDLADLARRGVPFDADTVEIWLEGTDWLAESVTLVEAGREAEVTLPPLMERVVHKATSMVAAVPGLANATFPRMPAVQAPQGPAAAGNAGNTGNTGTVAAPGTTTEPRMRAVPSPPAQTLATLPAARTDPSRPAVMALPRTTTAPNATLVLPALPGPALGGGAAGPQSTLMMQAVGATEWLVDVTIAETAATPHVRAFVVHKRVTEKLEVLDLVPPLADLRRGVLPDRTLRLRVKGTLDAPAIRALVMALPDVMAVSVNAAATASATAKTPAVDPAAARTVRVRTELLDELIDSVGEILLARTRLRTAATRMEDPELNDLADEFARLAQGLHERVMGARMTPVSVVADRLPRLVRDASRKRGKEVVFSVEGMEIELDRAILDELHDPLLHLVRNAVDHAHEGGEARAAKGKPPAMTLTLSATRDRDHVLISLADNGRGLDPDALRAAAVEKGLLTAEDARALSDQAAREIICLPGFSTAREVDDMSGRGVGMDAVRSTVERLGGQLLMESQVGVGTTFVLRLPLTVAIIKVLLVGAGPRNQPYAVPLHRVDHAVEFDPRAVVRNRTDALYPVGDTLAPLHDMAQMLGFPAVKATGGTVVVLDDPRRPLAVRVDAILGQQDVVVKPLGQPLSHVPFIAGAALLADGSPTYILDLAKLMATPQGRLGMVEHA
jgi:two-component system chemotaxis sensor kinase CheA